MSVLNITTIQTANNTTDLTIQTGNSSSGGIVVYSNGNAVALKSNSSTNAALVYSNGAVSVVSNTFLVGNFSNTTSGYTILPNRIKLNWGSAVPNTVGSNTITFASPFTSNAYSITITPVATADFATRISSYNNSSFTVVTSNTTGNATNTNISSIQYLAIGPV